MALDVQLHTLSFLRLGELVHLFRVSRGWRRAAEAALPRIHAIDLALPLGRCTTDTDRQAWCAVQTRCTHLRRIVVLPRVWLGIHSGADLAPLLRLLHRNRRTLTTLVMPMVGQGAGVFGWRFDHSLPSVLVATLRLCDRLRRIVLPGSGAELSEQDTADLLCGCPLLEEVRGVRLHAAALLGSGGDSPPPPPPPPPLTYFEGKVLCGLGHEVDCIDGGRSERCAHLHALPDVPRLAGAFSGLERLRLSVHSRMEPRRRRTIEADRSALLRGISRLSRLADLALHFGPTYPTLSSAPPAGPPIVFPSLTRLSLTSYFGDHTASLGMDDFLPVVCAPALTCLSSAFPISLHHAVVRFPALVELNLNTSLSRAPHQGGGIALAYAPPVLHPSFRQRPAEPTTAAALWRLALRNTPVRGLPASVLTATSDRLLANLQTLHIDTLVQFCGRGASTVEEEEEEEEREEEDSISGLAERLLEGLPGLRHLSLVCRLSDDGGGEETDTESEGESEGESESESEGEGEGEDEDDTDEDDETVTAKGGRGTRRDAGREGGEQAQAQARELEVLLPPILRSFPCLESLRVRYQDPVCGTALGALLPSDGGDSSGDSSSCGMRWSAPALRLLVLEGVGDPLDLSYLLASCRRTLHTLHLNGVCRARFSRAAPRSAAGCYRLLPALKSLHLEGCPDLFDGKCV